MGVTRSKSSTLMAEWVYLSPSRFARNPSSFRCHRWRRKQMGPSISRKRRTSLPERPWSWLFSIFQTRSIRFFWLLPTTVTWGVGDTHRQDMYWPINRITTRRWLSITSPMRYTVWLGMALGKCSIVAKKMVASIYGTLKLTLRHN